MFRWWGLIAGGIAGTLSRYLMAGFVHDFLGSEFPYGTLIVNLTGCLAIGFLDALAEEKFVLSPNARVLLMTGFCGAYTTFSTFILETSHLFRDGEFARGAINIGASVIAGFLLFQLGSILGRSI